MATKKDKSKSKKSKSSTQRAIAPSHKDEAATMALYRWYIVTIEKTLLEAYATSPTKSPDFVAVLRSTIKGLYDAGSKPKRLSTDVGCPEGCPDGYECCKNGMCSPMCGVEPSPR